MRRVLAAAVVALSITGCAAADPEPDHSSEPSELRYFEYRIPDGGVVRCIERWPETSSAVLDCSWPPAGGRP